MNETARTDALKDDWPVTANRFVAYIDIMGFKNMVATRSYNDIYEMMKNMNESVEISINLLCQNESDEKLVKTITYSDSIMFYSKDDSFESLEYIIGSICLVTFNLFALEIPHKGAIACGLMTIDTDNSIYFGQPLIDAYLLQEELYFYGIIMHHTCEYQMKNIIKNKPSNVKEYLCAFKNNSSVHFAIEPLFSNIKIPKSKSQLLESIKKMRFFTSGSLRKYIENTEAFINGIEMEELF